MDLDQVTKQKSLTKAKGPMQNIKQKPNKQLAKDMKQQKSLKSKQLTQELDIGSLIGSVQAREGVNKSADTSPNPLLRQKTNIET